ncbi:MAG: TetR/AcrR family transcriptional regulator [Phenylobacterium sp.]|uniref:TetR/AcrR family transcriptional regulator n=1 Tax=Phenylobacterium sp. TaxID=1871053 RepID=UPI003BB4A5BE
MDRAVGGKTVPTAPSPPMSKGERTRNRLMDVAYQAVIRKGFAATSIEELVEAAGITKSGFFYHFRDKNDLARSLLDRYQAENDQFQAGLAARSRELSDDPLHALLIFLKLYAEAMEGLVENHPGCLVATITFQDQAFDREVRQRNADGLITWRELFLPWLQQIAARYPPHAETDLTALADGMFGATSAGLILSKALNDPKAVSGQVMLYRESIRMTFAPR